jgi:hypothetical protein
VEKHWIPKLPREHDVFLMEIFQMHNFSSNQLRYLNHCRLFLQVITLSDITSADGQQILSNAMQGFPILERTSTLHCQGKNHRLKLLGIHGVWR